MVKMKNKINIILSFLFLLFFSMEIFSAGKIGIIVNKDLYPYIQKSIEQYRDDLKKIEQKDSWLNGFTFSEMDDKKILRDSLRYHYNSDNLEGVVMIGDLPICNYFEEDKKGRSALSDIFPCDLYYMDLNGNWTPEDMPTTHSGNRGAEIWVSRLVSSVLTHYGDLTEVEILQRYFDRVHLRMYGQDKQRRKYVIAGMYWEWSTLESENRRYLDYRASEISTYRSYYDSSYHNSILAEEWAAALRAGQEYAYVYSHAGGRPDQHKMGYRIRAIYEDSTNCRFYNVFCCQNARYTTGNMCGAYATEDKGLISVGSAKTGSMIMGSYRYYNQPLGQGKSFGEAFKYWFNNAGISNIHWHYGMIMQGAGTLHLQPYDAPNDNKAPTELSLSNNSIDENAGENVFVGTLSTEDPDMGQIHTYRLIYGVGDTDNDKFTIQNDSLFANSSFDYELQDTLTIRIRTTDNGTGNLWLDKSFIITVNDINETPTAINLTNQNINENDSANAQIGILSSTDPDFNQNHTYSFVTGTGDTDNDNFLLKNDTLFAKNSFNYETKSLYTIRIRSTDDGVDSLWLEKVFLINILNVNEAPTNLLLSAKRTRENSGSNIPIGTFSTLDPDTGQTFTYTLVNGDGSVDNSSFTITNDTLKAITSFNYEIKNKFSIRVRTTDNVPPIQFYEAVFNITITDINETPTSLALTGQKINENAGASAFVGTFFSEDPDSGQIHIYTLVNGIGNVDNSHFLIIGDTLCAKNSFDYETKDNYHIRIRATDNGSPNLFIEKFYTVFVNDINEAPHGLVLSNNSIKENSCTNKKLGTFSTTDPDRGQTFTYSLTPGTGSSDNNCFSMKDNILFVQSTFDYETKSMYTIRIRTADDGIGNLWFEDTFTINVINVNEAPKDLILSTKEIKENAGKNAEIGELFVTDPDTGQICTYTLEKGMGNSDNQHFIIDNNRLLAKKSFNYEKKNTYSIHMRATDNGEGNLSCENSFSIAVIDINEAPEDITLDNLIIMEKRKGVEIGNITITDPDINDEHSLSIDDTSFEIVSKVLKLKDSTQLIYDSLQPFVPVIITAVDKGGLSVSKDFKVFIEKDTSEIIRYLIVVPNPVIRSESVIFQFNTRRVATAEMKIFDPVGNLVYDFDNEALENGEVRWNLINKQDRKVGSGTYLAVLQTTDIKGKKHVIQTFVGVKEILE